MSVSVCDAERLENQAADKGDECKREEMRGWLRRNRKGEWGRHEELLDAEFSVFRNQTTAEGGPFEGIPGRYARRE